MRIFSFETSKCSFTLFRHQRCIHNVHLHYLDIRDAYTMFNYIIQTLEMHTQCSITWFRHQRCIHNVQLHGLDIRDAYTNTNSVMKNISQSAKRILYYMYYIVLYCIICSQNGRKFIYMVGHERCIQLREFFITHLIVLILEINDKIIHAIQQLH